MGNFIPRFRNKPITEVLEKIDGQIKKSEVVIISRRARQRRLMISLMLYSIILEVSYFVYFYFFVYTQEQEDPLYKPMHATPLIVVPSLAWILKTIINAYYAKRIANDTLYLAELKAKQSELIRKFAMDTNFYENQRIMQKFGSGNVAPVKGNPTKQAADGLRQRNPPQKEANSSSSIQNKEQALIEQQKREIEMLRRSLQQKELQQQQIQQKIQNQNNQNQIPSPPSELSRNYTPSPRHIMAVPADHRNLNINRTETPIVKKIDPNRPWYDKLVDMLIGDTVENSVALICEKCESPSGVLVSPDQVQTAHFTCPKCEHENLPFSQRPKQPAPKTEGKKEEEDKDQKIEKTEEEKPEDPKNEEKTK